MFQGTSYFMSAIGPSMKLIIMASLCWIMFLICVLPQPNLSHQSISFPHTWWLWPLPLSWRGEVPCMQFLMGYLLSLLLIVLQACCTDVLVSVCVNLRETGSFKEYKLFKQFTLSFVQHRLGELLSFLWEKLSASLVSSFTKSHLRDICDTK